MSHRITLLPGDGIGPEVMAATVAVLEATGISFIWDTHSDFGAESNGKISEAVIESITINRVALKGPTATPSGEGHRSLNVQLREKFGLYGNVRPIRVMPGVKTRFSDLPIDLVIFRENLEDLYAGLETDDALHAEALSVFTVRNCDQIARLAFEYARQNRRRKVTIAHKANILKLTHGLFLNRAKVMAASYPDIECEDLIADNCFMQLVQRPERFDCLLLPNFLGDLASDLCAGLVGGLGVAPGANIGLDCGVFEAVHGTAPDIAGKGIANPTSLILSAAMMLEYLDECDAADAVRAAIDTVLGAGLVVTGDINKKSPATTMQFADAVAKEVKLLIKAVASVE